MTTNPESVAEAFADGPLKATHKATVRDGKKREKRLDRLRLQGFWPVYAAFIALALRPPLAEEHVALVVMRFLGLGFALLGVAMRIWSMGYLMKKTELATAGPYGRTRNPLYVGTWLIGCGLALLAAWPFNLILLAVYNALFFVVYRLQIGIEEEMLSSIYGEPYRVYCANVPRFFPQFKAWRVGDVSRFSLKRAFQNRAWEPVLGLLLLLALQVAAWGLIWPAIKEYTISEAWRQFISGG
ncbi:MAG: isoprenylcysteine carboxylmethyltransferase family protein [Planctomycetes bacterium]|nr:isoprenylcysteine carboxylmethyltransferase family protein [Planctomycetota bacterium]MCB9935280.1 isoprenylcysteine carboxylmethyltransferase family protein [Planctomycetota bacterium]